MTVRSLFRREALHRPFAFSKHQRAFVTMLLSLCEPVAANYPRQGSQCCDPALTGFDFGERCLLDWHFDGHEPRERLRLSAMLVILGLGLPIIAAGFLAERNKRLRKEGAIRLRPADGIVGQGVESANDHRGGVGVGRL